MFVKVIFHGALRKLCPDEYKVDASTPSEAIRAVTNQLKDKLIRKDGQRFVCSVKECPRDVDLNSCVRGEELNVYPSFCASGGGKKGGLINMAIGAVLITVGAVMMFTGVGTAFAPSLIMAGAGMFLTGVMNYFFPMKDTSNDSSNPESSRVFGNSGNTTKIGTRIPVGYGKYKIAGQYLSINTQATDRWEFE